METKPTLFDIYTEYQKGNRGIISELFELNTYIDYDNFGKHQRNLIVKIPDLRKMINRAYSEFTVPTKGGIRYKKFSASKYTGTKEDMTSIFCSELIKIFNNGEATDKKKLFALLKANVTKVLNDEIKKYDTTKELLAIVSDDDIADSGDNDYFDEEDSNDLTANVADENDYFELDRHSGFHFGFIEDLLDIMDKFNITEMLSDNNEVARNIIDMFLHSEFSEHTIIYDEKIGETKSISQAEMCRLYYNRYGKAITEEQSTEAYNTIYKIMCKCVLEAMPSSRKQFKNLFCKVTDNNGKQAEKSPTISRKVTESEKEFADSRNKKSEYIILMEKKFGRKINVKSFQADC